MRGCSLTFEQLTSFREQGFVSVPEFADPGEIAALRPIYDRLFAERAGWSEGNFFDLVGADDEAPAPKLPQLLHPSRYAPELLESPVMAAAWATARVLLGPSATLAFDHAIFKRAGCDQPTRWHQDEAFWDERYDHDALSIWVPLQAVDELNGCMSFIPRSHLFKVMAHQSVGGDPRVHGLEIIELDETTRVACPLPLGGATIHHARTAHFSGPNFSGGDRRAYILTFFGMRTRRLMARNHYWNAAKKTARMKRMSSAG